MVEIRSLRHAALCAALLCAAAGCSSPPARVDSIARGFGLEPVTVSGSGFEHRAYVRPQALSSSVVHVYLEGDGLPWETRHRISDDPTPRYPLALHLASKDPTPSLLLGRPCYYGLSASGGCRPWMWTSGRYGEAVVQSMVSALERMLPDRPGARLTLVGYSGGGVLAMLMAERLPRVERVITLAANLDIDAWADLHGYSRLAESVNPAARPVLPARIRRVHFAGERDGKVPSGLIREAASLDPEAEVRVLSGFDHRCCWVERWSEILAFPELE